MTVRTVPLDSQLDMLLIRRLSKRGTFGNFEASEFAFGAFQFRRVSL